MICDENNLKAQRAEDCAAETAKTHGVDPAALAKRLPGGRMGQKKNKRIVRIDAGGGIHVKRVKQLLDKSHSHPPRPLSARVKNQFMGPDVFRLALY
jgi:hypothetical protein